MYRAITERTTQCRANHCITSVNRNSKTERSTSISEMYATFVRCSLQPAKLLSALPFRVSKMSPQGPDSSPRPLSKQEGDRKITAVPCRVYCAKWHVYRTVPGSRLENLPTPPAFYNLPFPVHLSTCHRSVDGRQFNCTQLPPPDCRYPPAGRSLSLFATPDSASLP